MRDKVSIQNSSQACRSWSSCQRSTWSTIILQFTDSLQVPAIYLTPLAWCQSISTNILFPKTYTAVFNKNGELTYWSGRATSTILWLLRGFIYRSFSPANMASTSFFTSQVRGARENQSITEQFERHMFYVGFSIFLFFLYLLPLLDKRRKLLWSTQQRGKLFRLWISWHLRSRRCENFTLASIRLKNSTRDTNWRFCGSHSSPWARQFLQEGANGGTQLSVNY